MIQGADVMVVLQFAVATLLPVLVTAALALLERRTRLANVSWGRRQVLYGIVFGLVAVYGTEAGIPTHDATMNVRDAAPLAAALYFGGPAGIIAGVIGGVERWFAALWGRGMFSRLGCSISTVLAGFLGAVLRRYVSEDKRPSVPGAFVMGFSIEALHMLMIFVTNLDEAVHAYLVTRACTIPMTLCNAVSVALCGVVYAVVNGEELCQRVEIPHVSHKVRTGMVVVAFVCLQTMLWSLSSILDNLWASGVLVDGNGVSTRSLVLLVASLMVIVLLASLFLANFMLIRKTVVQDVVRINERLDQICAGDLDVEVDVRDSAEFASLSDGINTTVGALRDAIAAESARIERDLETAKVIQESALPRTFPPFPDVDSFDIYASMNAAREVGGDFYDFFMVDDHTLGFLIADVSGKGIPAALFMMEAKAELSHCMRQGTALSEAVRSANWNICRGNDSSMFVTVWAATLDYTTGELTYVNAGHNAPLLRHDGSWQWLKKRCGLILGTFDGAKYRQETLTLTPGDELLLYTDGLNEAFNVEGEQYGNERLESFLASHADLSPRVLVDALSIQVRRWEEGTEQSDDITMLCLEYGVPPTISWSIDVPVSEEGLGELLRRLRYKLDELGCPADASGEVGIAVGLLFDSVLVRARRNARIAEQARFAYIYIEQTHSLIFNFIDYGAPMDTLAFGRPGPDEMDAQTFNFGEAIRLEGADEATYIRDGDRNLIVFRKTW